MMEPRIPIHIDKRKLARLCARRMIKELSLFGAVLQEDFRPDGDIDILIKFREDAPRSLLDWLDTIDDLRQFFGHPIDPVSDHTLRNRQRRARILKTRQVIYAA